MVHSCDNCQAQYFVPGQAGNTIIEGGCPDCGGHLRPERDQPPGSKGDGDYHTDLFSQDGVEHNPLQEGIMGQTDGGFKNRLMRDESYASVQVPTGQYMTTSQGARQVQTSNQAVQLPWTHVSEQVDVPMEVTQMAEPGPHTVELDMGQDTPVLLQHESPEVLDHVKHLVEGHAKTAGPLAELAAPLLGDTAGVGGLMSGAMNVGRGYMGVKGLGQLGGDVLGGGGGGGNSSPSEQAPMPDYLTASTDSDLQKSDTPRDFPGTDTDDPEKVDPKEKNDRPDNQVDQTDEEAGSLGSKELDPAGAGVERFMMLLPLVMHYFNSEESGADDPLLKGLHESLAQEDPDYLEKGDPQAAHELTLQFGDGHHHKSRLAGPTIPADVRGGPATWGLHALPGTSTDPDAENMSPAGGITEWRINVGNADGEAIRQVMATTGAPFQVTSGGFGGYKGYTEPSVGLDLYGVTAHQVRDVLQRLGQAFPQEESFGVIPKGMDAQVWSNPSYTGQAGGNDPGLSQSPQGLGGERESALGGLAGVPGLVADHAGNGPRSTAGAGGSSGIRRNVRPAERLAFDVVVNHWLWRHIAAEISTNPMGQATCPHCGALMPPGQMVCPQCGAQSGAVREGANHQGPHTPEQIAAVQQLLMDQGRTQEVPNVPIHPWQYGNEMAEIQQKPFAPPEDVSAQAPQPQEEAPPEATMPVPGMSLPPGQASHTAADNMAPVCPECGSHTTGLLSTDQDENHCLCHSCHHTWEHKDRQVDSADHGAPLHGDDSQGEVSADQQHPQMPTQDQGWTTDDGSPLTEGQQYLLHTPGVEVPDRVRVEQVKPDSIVLSFIGEYNMGFTKELSREEFNLEHYSLTSDAQSQPEVGQGGPDEALSNDDNEHYTGPGTGDLSHPHQVLTNWHVAEATTAAHEAEQQLPQVGAVTQSIRNRRAAAAVASGGEAEMDIKTLDALLAGGQTVLDGKTAGAHYDPSAQRELIDESGEARNRDRLDLTNTHYELSGLDSSFLW